jgi:hypothetical protein
MAQDWEEKIEGAAEDVEDAIKGVSRDDQYLMPENEALRRRVEQHFKERRDFLGHLLAYVPVNLGLWLVYLFSSNGVGFPWPVFVTLGWGAGLAAHAVETWFKTGERAERRFRAVQNALVNEFGEDYAARITRKEVKSVRRRVEKPFKKRAEFFSHAAVYVLINLMLWLVYFVSINFFELFGAGSLDAPDFPWPIIVMLGWGAGLLAHGAETFGGGSRESAIEREMARRQRAADTAMYAAYDEKPKRDRLLRLTDDGEIEEVPAGDAEKPKRQTRL